MATTGPLLRVSDQRKRWPAESCVAARSQEERQTMSVPEPRSRQPKPLAAGVFQPEIGSFRLCLAAEGKAGKTVRMYTQAGQWFAPGQPIPPNRPAQAGPGSAQEITVRGKTGKARIVRINHQTALSLDRYIRVRARHAQAYRPQLWLGVNNRGPMTGERHLSDDCAPRPPVRGGRVSAPVPSPFQPHLAGQGRGRGGPDGAERVDLAADAAPLRRPRPQHTRPPQLRPHHAPHHLTRPTAPP